MRSWSRVASRKRCRRCATSSVATLPTRRSSPRLRADASALRALREPEIVIALRLVIGRRSPAVFHFDERDAHDIAGNVKRYVAVAASVAGAGDEDAVAFEDGCEAGGARPLRFDHAVQEVG